MEIIVLVENTVYTRGLSAQHGLSFFIEANDKKILFDVGANSMFLENALKMNIEIADVDILLISHGHYDHMGGLDSFLKVNQKAKIYIKQQAFVPKFRDNNFIGVPIDRSSIQERIVFVEDLTMICPSIYVVPDIDIIYKSDTQFDNFYIEKNAMRYSDNFDDELFMVIEEPDLLTIISSCSHCGITNIIETAINYFQKNIKRIIGGFHLKNTKKNVVEHVIQTMNELEVAEIFTGHCTGFETIIEFNKNFDGSTIQLNVGQKINF